jgi:hypothetical protein
VVGGSWCEVLGSGVYNVSEFTTLWLEVRVSKSIVFYDGFKSIRRFVFLICFIIFYFGGV